MRLETKTLKAKEVTEDCFIYVPEEGMFFWVDDIDHEDNFVVFYFEAGIEDVGIDEHTIIFEQDQELTIYNPYAN